MPKKEENNNNNNALTPSGLSGKTVTGLVVWQQGNVVVVEINFAGGPTFIKVRNMQAEIGGDASWGSGTRAF